MCELVVSGMLWLIEATPTEVLELEIADKRDKEGVPVSPFGHCNLFHFPVPVPFHDSHYIVDIIGQMD